MIGNSCRTAFFITLFLYTTTVNSVKKEEAILEPQEIETTTSGWIPTEDVLDGKLIPNFLKKWIPPDMLWDLLNFPIAPNEEESTLLLSLDPPPPSSVDVAHYNLGLFEGLVDGTLPCDCGRPLGRVVNGKDARINNIPWTCALAYRDSEQPFCGGTVINDRYILTAGHCVRSTKPGEIQVWLNDENFLLSNETVGGRLVYDVIEIKKHPQYKAYFNDIALLRLNETIQLGSREEFVVVNPVCLPVDNDSNDYAGYEGTVAGWGKTSPGGKVSPALLKIKVPIWSNEECRRESKYKESIRDNMMCAGFKEGGTDACQGDSGGPLIIRKNITSLGGSYDEDDEGTAVLVGIVSWGFGCAERNAPGVYTRLSVYTKWVLENTLDAQYCQVYSKIK